MFITLNKITADRRRDFHSDTDEPGEAQANGITSTPVRISVAAIRCFYPRKDNAPGTRITFTDGGGFAVTEDFAVVAGMVTPS
jgi:hypothetical protein